MFEHRSLMMRANRLLGANLVEHNLVKMDALETANGRFLDAMGAGEGLPRHLLSILLFEQQALREDTLLQYQIDEMGTGLFDLRQFELADDVRSAFDPGILWATATVPFDREDDVHYVATAYYLSPVIREHWGKLLPGQILWYVTPMDAVVEHIESLVRGRAQADGNRLPQALSPPAAKPPPAKPPPAKA